MGATTDGGPLCRRTVTGISSIRNRFFLVRGDTQRPDLAPGASKPAFEFSDQAGNTPVDR
jgi:hypothetical protein